MMAVLAELYFILGGSGGMQSRYYVSMLLTSSKTCATPKTLRVSSSNCGRRPKLTAFEYAARVDRIG